MRGMAMRMGVLSVLALMLAVCSPDSGTGQAAAAPGPQAGPAGAVAATGPNLRMTNDVRVYQMVKDAVVNISTTKIVTARVGTGDPFFDQFMGGVVRQVPAQSLGSGFVIHPSGYIVTNEHVVDEGTDVECVFASGEKLPAQVIATDNEHDLAVLKVEPKKPLTAIALGSSDDLMIGEPVYAIGNPFGFAGTMTRGIVSALNRTLDVSPQKSYKGLIQTDALINPGNSGGPLLNAYGQVVGINTAIRADAQGIGFAIAVSHMRDLLPAFLNAEALNKAQVGFTVEERRTMKPPSEVTAVVYVKTVQAGSNADKAGLKAEDELVAVGSGSVGNVVDALVAISSAKAGETLGLRVLRGGKEQEVKVAVTKSPPSAMDAILLTKMGIKGETVTAAVATRNHLAVAQGVYVTGVQADSPAAKCSMQPGDVLYQLGRYSVTSVEDVAALLRSVKDPVDVNVVIFRGNARGRGTMHLQ